MMPFQMILCKSSFSFINVNSMIFTSFVDFSRSLRKLNFNFRENRSPRFLHEKETGRLPTQKSINLTHPRLDVFAG